MSDLSSTPRIPPLTPEEQTPDQKEMLESMGPRQSKMNIFTTLARHPGLFRRWMPFGGKLLQGGKLSPRDRELIILRTAVRCNARYEWAQHVPIGQQAGLSDEEMRRVAEGPDAAGWSEEDAVLLRAVDEIHDDHRIGEATWASLAERYTTEQLIEVPMLSGHYALLAGALNSFGTQVEREDQPKLGEV